MTRRSARVLLVLAMALPCGTAVPRADPLFVDVSASRNVVFQGTYGPTFPWLGTQSAMMQRNMGNGAAVGDYDGDGDLDVYLLGQLGHRNVLLRNDLAPGVKWFTDVTSAAGLEDLGMSRVAQFTDLNNDGRPDLILLNDDDGSGDYPPGRIFRNDGGGSFSDVTPGSGFTPVGLLRCGLAVADYDRDGLLDIYVTNWGFQPGDNRLYRNLGSFRFADVTIASGLGILDNQSFAAIFHDFDDDRYPDLLVAVDHRSDEFYVNEAGVFRRATLETGATHVGNDMGLAAADFDDDGDLDVYSTNITDPFGIFGTTQYNILYANRHAQSGTILFVDEAIARGVQDTYWGWGTEFTDVENDGDLDIVAVTGFDEYILAQAGSTSPIYRTPSVLFVNDGAGAFSLARPVGLESPDDSRALVAFDYDRDGDEDLLITNVDQPARLLENVSAPQGHWLAIDFVQAPGSNREGAGVVVYATLGARTLRRDRIAGGSYLAGRPPEMHVGLGGAAAVDALRVVWTDGTESTFTDVQADRSVRIVQGVPDADLDGLEDGLDNCPNAVNADQSDADLDGAGDACDCAASDPSVWSAPAPIRDLSAEGEGETRLAWTESPPAGSATRFDLLRAESPGFSVPTCILSASAELEARDASIPGGAWFYVVRAVNPCGRESGADSLGRPRILPDCP